LKAARAYKLDFYEYCVIRKKTKVKFGTMTHYIENILDYIHTDILEPTKTASIRGNH